VLIGTGLTGAAAGLVASYLCLLLLVYLYPWSLIDAWRTAGEPGLPSPDRAGILSLLLPGLGQAYLGLYSRGWKVWCYVAAAWALLISAEELGITGVLSDVFTALALSTGAAPVLSAWDAYRTAKRIRAGR